MDNSPAAEEASQEYGWIDGQVVTERGRERDNERERERERKIKREQARPGGRERERYIDGWVHR